MIQRIVVSRGPCVDLAWMSGVRTYGTTPYARADTPAALDTIRGISADAIKPQESVLRICQPCQRLSRAGSTVGTFVNDYHAVPGFEQVLLNWAKRAYWRANGKNTAWVSSKAAYTRATYVMKYVTGKKLPAAALRFEWPVSINDTRLCTEVTAPWVDIVLSGGDKLHPGVTIQLELKSWTEAMLRIKARSPTGQSTTYPGTVGYQLIRDTALFRPENIRWVFDSQNGLTRAQVIRAFERSSRTTSTWPLSAAPGSSGICSTR